MSSPPTLTQQVREIIEKIRKKKEYGNFLIVKPQKPIEDWAAYQARREQIAKQRYEADLITSLIKTSTVTYPLDRLYEPWDMAAWARQSQE